VSISLWIENGKVNFDNTRLASRLTGIPEPAVLAHLAKVGLPASGLLPPAVRWISPSGHQAIFERPPQIRTIQVTEPGARSREFTLPLPWTVYATTFGDDFVLTRLAVYASRGPLQTLEDSLHILPLLNVWTDGHFCLPKQTANKNLGDGLAAAYQAVWSSGFNFDITDHPNIAIHCKHPNLICRSLSQASPGVMDFYAAWEQLSLAEIVRVTDWASVLNLGQVINHLGVYEEQLLSDTGLEGALLRAVLAAHRSSLSRAAS
jgi:hypothetical protein